MIKNCWFYLLFYKTHRHQRTFFFMWLYFFFLLPYNYQPKLDLLLRFELLCLFKCIGLLHLIDALLICVSVSAALPTGEFEPCLQLCFGARWACSWCTCHPLQRPLFTLGFWKKWVCSRESKREALVHQLRWPHGTEMLMCCPASEGKWWPEKLSEVCPGFLFSPCDSKGQKKKKSVLLWSVEKAQKTLLLMLPFAVFALRKS